MNYLAHMVVGHWAGLDEKGVLGNFMGDAVKGRDVEGMWGVDVGRGIRLHRAIDDVSDRHEASRDCLLYTSPSPRDLSTSRMPSSA